MYVREKEEVVWMGAWSSTPLEGWLCQKRLAVLQGKALDGLLSQTEQVELETLQTHRHRTPAVLNRIWVLTVHLARRNRWYRFVLRLSRKFRQNVAELDALLQYGDSAAVWDIAYLARKRAVQRLSPEECREWRYLVLYHDHPHVHRLVALKLRGEQRSWSPQEQAEWAALHQDMGPRGGMSRHLLDVLWPPASRTATADEQPAASSVRFRLF